MKTLYLMGSRAMRVVLDGPALRIHQAGRAIALCPLGRIGRIVTRCDVDWDPRAIIACLRNECPIAVLDEQGRFVRIHFFALRHQNGLARHMGELLGVPRFRHRYTQWLQKEERRQMAPVAAAHGLPATSRRTGKIWQAILHAQARQQKRKLGACYRLLNGLATAQAASMLVRMGLPKDPAAWEVREYRFLLDLVRLESWSHPGLISRVIGSSDAIERDLVRAFEASAEERSHRFVRWRQQALLAMMGLSLHTKAETMHQNGQLSTGENFPGRTVRCLAYAHAQRKIGFSARVAPSASRKRAKISLMKALVAGAGDGHGAV